jgi:hypothetical protein
MLVVMGVVLEGSSPTALGPCVDPLSASAACEYSTGVVPVSPVRVNREE